MLNKLEKYEAKLRADARGGSAASAIAMAVASTEYEDVNYTRVVVEDDGGGTGTWLVRFQVAAPNSRRYWRTVRAYRVAQTTFEADLSMEDLKDD